MSISHWSQYLGTSCMHVTYLDLYQVELLPIGCVICKPIEYLLSDAAVPSGMEGGECRDAPITVGCSSEPAPTTIYRESVIRNNAQKAIFFFCYDYNKHCMLKLSILACMAPPISHRRTLLLELHITMFSAYSTFSPSWSYTVTTRCTASLLISF